MKRTTGLTIATLMLLGVLLGALLGTTGASAQSLGDYARQARKNKPKTDTTSRYYDNDNLPVNEQLSVVGPDPSAATGGDQKTATATTAATDPKAAQADRQKAGDEIKQKIDDQKSKLDALNHELDLSQREYRLRAATFYGDAGAQLRNSAQWSKDDTQYKSDMDSKQKAIAAAQQQLSDLQEQARKAGMREKESDSDKEKEKK
jgi:hypothetical protein